MINFIVIGIYVVGIDGGIYFVFDINLEVLMVVVVLLVLIYDVVMGMVFNEIINGIVDDDVIYGGL